MPIYEYRCQACLAVTEFMVGRIGATPADLKCGQCGSQKMTKALSTIAVHGAPPASPCKNGQCPVPAAQRTCLGGRCSL